MGPTPLAAMEQIEGELRAAKPCEGSGSERFRPVLIAARHDQHWVELPCSDWLQRAVATHGLGHPPVDKGPRVRVHLEPERWFSDASWELRRFELEAQVLYDISGTDRRTSPSAWLYVLGTVCFMVGIGSCIYLLVGDKVISTKEDFRLLLLPSLCIPGMAMLVAGAIYSLG